MPHEIPIALTMFTVRDDAAADYLGTVRKVADMGYQGIQTHFNAVDPTALVDLADELGVSICGVHTAFEVLRDEPDKAIAFNLAARCMDVTCSGIPGDYRNPEGYKDAGRLLAGASDLLADAGIRLTYHNHDFEFADQGGETGHDLLFDAAGATLECELDVYWLHYGGQDVVRWMMKFANRLPLLHIKDMEAGDERFFAEIGEGVLDWTAIFRAADEAGVEWAIVEQDLCRRPPLESARLSIENLKKMGFA
ncbi:MAG: sugar phosphate isomerase/epimerase [Armatimonadota bacterium]